MIQMFPADFPKFPKGARAAALAGGRENWVKEVKLIDDEAWARQFNEAREGVLFALRQRFWNGIRRSPSSAIETCPSLPTRRWTIRAIDPDEKKKNGRLYTIQDRFFPLSFEITRLSRRRRKRSERYSESIKSQGHSNNMKFKEFYRVLLLSKLIIYRYLPTIYTQSRRGSAWDIPATINIFPLIISNPTAIFWLCNTVSHIPYSCFLYLPLLHLFIPVCVCVDSAELHPIGIPQSI